MLLINYVYMVIMNSSMKIINTNIYTIATVINCLIYQVNIQSLSHEGTGLIQPNSGHRTHTDDL